jgi:hypothetical protein
MLCNDGCQCCPLPSPPPPLQRCRSDFSGCFRSWLVERPLPLAARRGGVSSRCPLAVNHHLAAASPQLVLSPRLYRLRHPCTRTASGEWISISIFSMTMQVGRRQYAQALPSASLSVSPSSIRRNLPCHALDPSMSSSVRAMPMHEHEDSRKAACPRLCSATNHGPWRWSH